MTDDQHSRAGKAGAASLLARYGPDHMSRIGKRGGEKTWLKHGPKHFREMGRESQRARRVKKAGTAGAA